MMNIQQQQQGQSQQYQDYYQQGDQGYLDNQQYDEYYQKEYLDDQGYQQGPGYQYPQQGNQQNQGYQYPQQGDQGNQEYYDNGGYDDGQGYADGEGYEEDPGYYEYGGESQQYQSQNNHQSQQQHNQHQQPPRQNSNNNQSQQYQQQQQSQGQKKNSQQSQQQQNSQDYNDDQFDQKYDQYQQNNMQNRNNSPPQQQSQGQNKNKQSQQQYRNYQQQQQNFQDYNDDQFDQQYDQYQQNYPPEANPFDQFQDGNLDQGGNYGDQNQNKQDYVDSFDLKKERSILNRIFQAKNPKHDLSKVKAMEALSEKHKNVDTWLHTTLANNPDMVTMNKFVQLGLVKSKPSAPQEPKPLNKAPRENPFKLEAHTNVKLEDPKNFSEIKSFYYTNLFEEEVIDINNIVHKKKAEAALLIMQIGQRRLECDTITMKINTYKAPGLNQEKLQGGKDFIEYLMQHCRGQIASVFEKAPFSPDEILQELERQIPSNDEEGYFLLEKSSKRDIFLDDIYPILKIEVELQKIDFHALNQENRTAGDPIKAYKQEMDMKVRKGKKLFEIDHVDLRALKNRLNSTSICDFVGAYYAHEREGTLATFSEGIKKSLCSQQRADRFLYMIRLVKDLEINYLREQQKNPSKPDKPLQYNRDSIYEKDIPLPVSEPSTDADGKKEDISIYSFIPFWFVDWIDTSDRKSRILRDMLNVNLAIATKIYKLTSALNLDEFIQYYRKHKGERELDIFTPQDAKALITLGWSLEMVEEFVERISNLSEQAIALPKLLFDYGRAQPNLEILEVKGLQGLPLAAYSAIITSVLVHKNNIRGVRLNDLDLMPDSIPILQFLINNKDKKIMEVSLMNNHLKDEGSYRLLQFSKLDASFALKIIRLDRCGITSQGGIYISSLLKEAAYLQGSSLKLQILTLSGNSIGNSAVQTLLFALRTNTSLQYLDLSNNKVRDLPLTVVFDTLKQNKTLQILYLHENRFSDRAISQLFEDAEEYTNTSLLVLKLGILRAIPDHIVKLIRLTLPSIKNLRYCEIFTPAVNRDVNQAIPLAIQTYPVFNPIILKVMDHQLEVGFHSLADLMIEIMYEKTKQDSPLNNKPVSPITGAEANKNNKKGVIDTRLPFELETVVKKLSEDFYGSATFECVCYLLETYLTYDTELKEGDSFIHRMAHHNQTEAVSYMLKLHANPDILTKPTFPGFPKATLLHIAVAINSLPLIAEVIMYGAKLDIRDANDNTPLHYAASLGQLELCSFLIEKGCSSDLKNKKRMEPLHASILSNDFEVLDFFIENRNPQKDRQAAKALLEAPVSRGYSCAHLAIENNSVDIFHHLIKYEVDLNLQDAQKKTPLHLAIELDNSEIIETLLDQKVNLNLKDSHGETPVFYAVKKGNLELAQTLYNLGALLNLQTAKGDILLHFAAASDNVELIYWLLGRGLNPSKKNLFGQAPRDLARSKVIRDLLPVQSELPQFDIYGNNARISGRELEEKIVLREPSSRKDANSRTATIFTNSQIDPLEEYDEDYEEGDEEGGDGESEYEYEYEYEDEVEEEPAGQGGNPKQAKYYDDDYEDSDLDSEENSPTAAMNPGHRKSQVGAGAGRSRSGTMTRKRTLSKKPVVPGQNPSIPKVPSYQNNNNRVGGENSPAVNLGGSGGVAKTRALTPVRQNSVPNNKRLSQDYLPNQPNSRSYLGNNGYDVNMRSGGENGNRSMIINSNNERGGTPAKERLPPLRTNSVKPSYKGGNPFTEQEIAGTRNVGNHSYLNYLEEVAGKKEKEDMSRDYKLPIIKKEYS